jgi:hypothetical protein
MNSHSGNKIKLIDITDISLILYYPCFCFFLRLLFSEIIAELFTTFFKIFFCGNRSIALIPVHHADTTSNDKFISRKSDKKNRGKKEILLLKIQQIAICMVWVRWK